MPNKIFIAGTDTEIGKTHTSVGLLKKFREMGYSTLGIKPIASGCQNINGTLYNEDALLLQTHSSIKLPYHEINPYAFLPPIAPHIAAKDAGINLSLQNLLQKTRVALDVPADVHIVEGVGGWFVPLNERETMADFVKRCDFSVILVVGIRLGCLNHALLTYHAMKNAGIKLLGWVANFPSPDVLVSEEIIATLKSWIKEPCFGVLPYQKNPAGFFDRELLQRRALSPTPKEF